MEPEKIVTVCVNRRAGPNTPSCGARDGAAVADALEAAVVERGLPVRVERFKCLGRCARGLNVKLSPGGEFRHEVTMEGLPELLQRISAFACDEPR